MNPDLLKGFQQSTVSCGFERETHSEHVQYISDLIEVKEGRTALCAY